MNTQDAVVHLTANFSLIRVGTAEDGSPEYDYATPIQFTACVLDDERLTLIHPFADLDSDLPPDLERRLLEANLNGAGTGAGQIGRHPTLGLALIEVLDCEPLHIASFQKRFVDFMMHAEFLGSEVIPELLQERSVDSDDMAQAIRG